MDIVKGLSSYETSLPDKAFELSGIVLRLTMFVTLAVVMGILNFVRQVPEKLIDVKMPCQTKGCAMAASGKV